MVKGEGDALILFRLLGFSVGPVVYALNEFSPLSSFVISSFIVDSRGDAASCLRMSSPLGLVASKAYVFQWGYDGKQPSIVSLGTTSRLSGNQLEDDGSSACFLSLACIGLSQPS